MVYTRPRRTAATQEEEATARAYPAFSAYGWPKYTSAWAGPKRAHFGHQLAEATIFGRATTDSNSSAHHSPFSVNRRPTSSFRPRAGRKVPFRPKRGRQGHSFAFFSFCDIVSEFASKKVIVLKKNPILPYSNSVKFQASATRNRI